MALRDVLRLYEQGSIFRLTCVIVLLGQFEISVVAKGSNYYTAAVFEHVRYDDPSKSTPQEIIQENLDRYATAAKTAAEQEADIIVFPEWGLYNTHDENRSSVLLFAEDVPDPLKASWNPCEESSDFEDRPVLSHLSCMAKDNALFLVANIADVKKCVPDDTCDTTECSSDIRRCPPDGQKFFNTNVVFNRKGTLVARYHKNHLFFEPGFNVPKYPTPTYFDTDFGLFTTFICFDMAFPESVQAVEKRNVLNVAYSTFWFDHLPLMAAIQYQQAWAITNKVNLLAADVQHLGTGTVGSGIYAGTKGALVYTFNPDGEAKLLISRVPMERDFPQDFDTKAKIFRIRVGDVKDITDEDQDSDVPEQCSRKILGPPEDNYKDYRCSEFMTAGYSFEKLEDSTGSLEVCKNGICCSLSYSADSMDEDFYLGTYNDVSLVDDVYGVFVEACILIRCDKGMESETCSTYPLVSKTRFRSLKLSGNFNTKYVYPSVMNSKMRLASTKEWEFDNDDGQAEISYYSKSENSEPLLVVGLYGRCYDKDPNPHL